MRMFLLKCVLLVSLLFIAVLMGMEKANEGMQHLKGNGSGIEAPLTVKQKDNGEVQASVLGKDLSSSDIEGKRKKLEEMKTFNLFSAIGKTLADLITGLTEKLIDLVASFI
ncbi:DUF3679 domain-containing protein [Falsibacillus albus]|nr:DUF3679 domain-containing protein [Falsibacillus albus]